MPISSFQCPKCSTAFDIVVSGNPTPIPPDPTPVDPRPVQVFTPSGGDDTAALQDWLNAQPSDAIYDIRGVAQISSSGVTMAGKKNVKVTSTTGGGFRAISPHYDSAYASLVYAPNNDSVSFENLLFDIAHNSAQGLFIHKSPNSKILRCEVKDIVYVPRDGPPYAAIKGDLCDNLEIGGCNIHDLDSAPQMAVRGLWIGVGNELTSRAYIHDCVCSHTGHTGIVVEGNGPRVINNKVSATYGGGSGYKFVPRGDPDEAIWDNNIVDGTSNGGFMIEGSDSKPSKIWVRNWQASNVGRDGTTFAFLYVAGDAGTSNVQMSGCKLDNCKRVATLLYASNFAFSDLTVTNGEPIIECYQDCDGVTLVNAGRATIGPRVTNVWVDGVKKA